MMNADYYRDDAARARRIAHQLPDRPDVQRDLLAMAQDYDDIAIDLDAGAVEVRHPKRMPQNGRQSGGAN
jgi:hypothetical protein